MAYIRTISDKESEGRLAELYEKARLRAGKVYNVVRLMSLAPAHLDASIKLYREIMFGESPLSRAQREMIAVAVSRANNCYY